MLYPIELRVRGPRIVATRRALVHAAMRAGYAAAAMPKVACRACGEPLDAAIAAKSDGLCYDCYREIHLGEVPRVTDSSSGPVRSGGEGDESGADAVDPGDGRD